MGGTVHELEQKDLFWQVQSEAAKAAQQLLDEARLRADYDLTRREILRRLKAEKEAAEVSGEGR